MKLSTFKPTYNFAAYSQLMNYVDNQLWNIIYYHIKYPILNQISVQINILLNHKIRKIIEDPLIIRFSSFGVSSIPISSQKSNLFLSLK